MSHFLLFSIIKLTKLCIWIKWFSYNNTKIQINDHKIDWNHDTGLLIIKTWGKNELKISAQLGFSSEVKVPQLGSAPNLPSLAQLEPENSSSGSSLLTTQGRLETNGNGWPTCCVSGVVKVFGKTPGLMLLHPFCAGTIIVVGQHMMIVSVQTCQYRTSTRTTHWRSNKAVFKLGSWNIRN